MLVAGFGNGGMKQVVACRFGLAFVLRRSLGRRKRLHITLGVLLNIYKKKKITKTTLHFNLINRF